MYSLPPEVERYKQNARCPQPSVKQDARCVQPSVKEVRNDYVRVFHLPRLHRCERLVSTENGRATSANMLH